MQPISSTATQSLDGKRIHLAAKLRPSSKKQNVRSVPSPPPRAQDSHLEAGDDSHAQASAVQTDCPSCPRLGLLCFSSVAVMQLPKAICKVLIHKAINGSSLATSKRELWVNLQAQDELL